MFRFSALLLLFPSTAALAKAPFEFEEVGDEKYTEQVVAMADLGDGTYAKVQLGVSNVGPGDGKGGCGFFVVKPDGTVWRDSKIVDSDEVRYDAEKKSLSIGQCRATSGGDVVFEAKTPKGRVKMTLVAPAKRERVADANVSGDFWELDLLVKWADATVEIEQDGKTRVLSGRGYADHPRSKIMPGTLAKRWFRFRGLSEADPRLVMVRFPQSGPPIGWHDSAKGKTNVDKIMLAPGKDKSWRARFKGGDNEWRVTTTKLLHRDAPIEQQGKVLGSLIGAAVGNPVTYTYRGVLEERGSGAKIEGIVEVTITDE